MQTKTVPFRFPAIAAPRRAHRWELAAALFCGAVVSSAEYFASAEGSMSSIFWASAWVIVGGGLMATVHGALSAAWRGVANKAR